MNDLQRQLDVMWAAGFMEGEGCFGFYTYSPTIVVCQVDKEPIDRFSQIFEGTVRLKPAKGNSRPVWEWRAYGQRAVTVMIELRDHMSQRRKQKIDEVLFKWSVREYMRRPDRPCPKGHTEFGYRKSGVGKGARYCKVCSREYAAARKVAIT